MKILLDECVPWPLARLLRDHECSTPKRMGWGGISNGVLLAHAEDLFDLFITSDQNLRYQQNLQGRKIAILELSTNDWLSIQASSGIIVASVAEMSAAEYRRLLIET